MYENRELARKFYTAFQQKDFLTMQSLYHSDATFWDEVFQHLNSKEVKAMWQMLLTSSKDLRIEFTVERTGEKTVHAKWDAWYTFSKTGRPVHNVVNTCLVFRDGLIFQQVDGFNFWRWSRQSLGTSGLLLGWSPFLKNKVRATARAGLNKFMQSQK